MLITITAVNMKDRGVNMKTIYHALHDLVQSVQFKKREKNPWKSVTISKVAG